MKMKTIYTQLLLTVVCAGGAFAQPAPGEHLEKYYTLERIRSKSGWLVSDNAAGLLFNRASLSVADVNYDFEKGGLRNVDDGGRVHTAGIRSESFRRWDRLSFYGKLGYDYSAAADRSWTANALSGDGSISMGDSIPGNMRTETYALKAGVAYQMGRWAIGLAGEYEDRSLAKRRDARNRTTSMHFGIRPGVMFSSGAVNAGLNLSYERTSETVEYKNFGTNTTTNTIYFFEGLWFHTSEQLGSLAMDAVYYKGSEYGGAVQLELKPWRSVRFFNQFSARYAETERFRSMMDQHLGDNDRLTYRYLGVLDVAGRRLDHRLSVDASWGDLLKYNNIQEVETDPETNMNNYVQYGRFLKFSQMQRSVDAGYKLYVKRDAWSSSWIVDAAYSYRKTESEYTISPARYRQDMHSSKLTLGVTKNFLFNDRNWLDVTLRGGYTFGGGMELDKQCPEGVQIEGENYRADLVAWEYGFMTGDRLNGECGLRYTHYIPAKRIGIYVDLKGRSAWARSGLFDGRRRGGCYAAAGLNF